MSKPILYLAGGLFSAGEQLHNLYLERALKELGYKILLPQRDAGGLSSTDVVCYCQQACISPSVLLVGNTDGADADSGTAVEYGIAITITGRAVLYRTDFRTDEKNMENNVNIMFTIGRTRFVYCRASLTDLDQADEYYQTLAQHIDAAIKKIVG